MLAQNLGIISALALITAEFGGHKEDLWNIMVGKMIILMDHMKIMIIQMENKVAMMDNGVTSISQPNSAEEITLAPKML